MRKFIAALGMLASVALLSLGVSSSALADGTTSLNLNTALDHSSQESYWSIVSPNGRYLAVNNYYGGSVAIVNLQTNAVQLIHGGSNFAYPGQIQFSADSSLLYVADYDEAPLQVRVYTVSTGALHNTILIPGGSSNSSGIWTLAVSGHFMAVGVYGSWVKTFDISNPSSLVEIGTGVNTVSPQAMALSSDGTKVYYTSDGYIYTDVISTGVQTVSSAVMSGIGSSTAYAIAVFGNYIYLTDYQYSGIYKINADTGVVVASSTDSHLHYPWGVVTSRDGAKVYVSNYDGKLVVFNTSDMSFDASYDITHDTSKHLDAAAISPDGATDYVTDDYGTTYGFQVTQGVEPSSTPSSSSTAAPLVNTGQSAPALALGAGIAALVIIVGIAIALVARTKKRTQL